MIAIKTLITLQAKHDRACNKHDWTGYTLADVNAAIAGEQQEINQAEQRGQIHGPHGVIDETYDLIAVLLRKIEALDSGVIKITETNRTHRNTLVVRYRILLEILPLALKEAGLVSDHVQIAMFIQNAIDAIDHHVPASATETLLTTGNLQA